MYGVGMCVSRPQKRGGCVQALYAKLLEQCKAQGLAVHIENITDPGAESNGIMGHVRDYHGFVALTITHAMQ